MTPYFLKSGYISRETPKYFDDVLQDSTFWQADVYGLAAQLAKDCGITELVDIGCGRAEKLLQFADEFTLIGFDYGDNIKHLAQQYPKHEWIPVNLNQSVLSADLFENSVVICADVIEHLPDPAPLIQTLKNACKKARFVLLSTPDRERIHHGEHNGPPDNLHHVREWTNAELVQYLQHEGLPVKWHGWTVSHRKYPDQLWTSLVILSREFILGLPYAFEPAPIEWDLLGVNHA